jgi:hypothetical protein
MMRLFILKTIIIVIAFYILFQITIGHRLNYFSSKIQSLSNQHSRVEIKEKILNEIKKGTEKESIFTVDERLILSNFINKIFKELNVQTKN